jgi:hypothetical protein
MNRVEANQISTEIFILVLLGGEVDKLRAVEMIRKLPLHERRLLRASCERLCYLLDDVHLQDLREKRIARRKVEDDQQ